MTMRKPMKVRDGTQGFTLIELRCFDGGVEGLGSCMSTDQQGVRRSSSRCWTIDEVVTDLPGW